MPQMINGRYLDDIGLEMSRAGKALCRKVNGKDTLNAGVTLTDAGFLYAIPAGERVVITCFYFHLTTLSDSMTAAIGYTPNADGSGAFVAVTPEFGIETGAASTGSSPHVTPIWPPIVLAYSAGVCEALTAHVTTNDAGATVTLAMNGWHERV